MLPGQKSRKAIAATLLLLFFTQTFAPTISYALSSGPASPEAMSFEPVDTTDLVNLQTGSFVYNMPLIQVPGPEGGYPISLSYHAGIEPNMDASWVGLGWTLNPGAINRSVNGFPDDWKNLKTSDHLYWSGGSTTTYSAGVNIGFANSPFNVSFGLSVASDTYKGFSVGWNMGVGYANPATGEKTTLGLGMQPFQTSPSLSFGESGSSPAIGPVKISDGISMSTNFKTVQGSFSGGIGVGMAKLGASMSSSGTSRFTFGAGIAEASISSSKVGSVQTSTQGTNLTIPITNLVSVSLGYTKTRYWTDETTSQPVAGSFYPNSVLFGGAVYDVYSLLDNPSVLNIVDYPDPTVLAGGTYPSFDDYDVLAQGLSGSMRPYGFQQDLLVQNHYDASNNPIVTDDYVPGYYAAGPYGFRFVSDFSNSYRQAANQSQAYAQYPAGTTGPELATTTPPFSVPAYGNNDGNAGNTLGNANGGNANNMGLEGSRHIDIDYTPSPINDLGFTNAQYQNGMFNGFSITNESGVTYHYDLPAYSYGEENYQQKISTTNGLYFNRGTKSAGYAYTWYLTSITGPDWVDRDGNGVPSAGDWGYWVSFEYGKWSNHYVWRNPSEGYVNDDDNNFEDCSQGFKEVYYLNAIRTRSHIAIFEKDLRQDGKGVTPLTFNKLQQADQNGVVTGTSYTTAGGFDVNSAQSLQLSHIYLLNIADANFVTAGSSTNNSIYTPSNRTFGYSDEELPQNVIDANDVNQVGRYQLEAKAIRVIDFNYDYSMCPGTDNSFNIFSANPGPAPLEGKLTLNSVVTRGTGGANLIPPTQFTYELTGPDVVSQANVVFTNATAPNVPYFTTTSTSFHVGDMIESSIAPIVYWGVITAITPLGGGQYMYSLAGGLYNEIPAQGETMSIQTTKNPPYNMNAYDSWGMYKGDADPTLIANNVNMGRNTSPASGASADAWSLRKIYSPLGDYMKINYQSNTFHTSVMNNTYSYVMQNIGVVSGTGNQQITFNLATYGSTANPASLLSIGQYMSKILLDVDYSGAGLYCAIGAFKQPVSSVVVGGLTVAGISTNPSTGVTTITGNLDHPIPNTWYAASFFGITTGNLWINSTSDYVGGGVRVASISTNHSIDNTFSNVVYNYNSPAGVSSGTTSYLPSGLDAYDVTALNSTTGANYCELTDDVAAYEAALYQNTNALYPIARELPPPGVMYQYATVTNQVQNPDESLVRTVPGSTQYQFEVFQPGMVFRDELPPLVWGDANIGRNWVIRKFTSGIGNIKTITQFDNNGRMLSQTINHYLHDNLESQGATYDNFFTPYLTLLEQPPYNYQGLVQERYVDVKTIAANYKPPTAPPGYGANIFLGGTWAALSGREDYPCIQTGQTVINYVNGVQTSTTNLGWDYYSGAVTQSVETDAYGNNIMTETVPAYTAPGNGAMGLKIKNDANKGMLTQVAETRKWKVDANNNKLELMSAHVNTWSDNNNVIDINGNAYVQNSATTNGDVWRTQSAYDWLSASQTKTADGLTPVASFNDFNWATPASSDPGWKNTANATLYDVYSNLLEGNDVNGNYSATHMDYGNQKVILTGGPANYYEIAYSGAEDANVTQTNGTFVNGGSGTVVAGAAIVHTGAQSLLLNSGGTKGFTYSVPTAHLVAGRNYEASVWIKPAGSTSTVGLYYDIDGTIQGSASSGTPGLAKPGANGFYLLKLFINGSSIVSGHTLNVWVRNDNTTIPAYVDDFRFQPQNASTAAYVYDPVTSQLDYVLDNSNVFTEYTYDAAGNLLQTLKEKLGFPEYIAKQWQYNYSATQYYNQAISGNWAKNNCSVLGDAGIPMAITVPAGMFNSFISQADAQLKAGAYAQEYADMNGTCSCQPTFAYTSGITPTYQAYTLSGTTTNFTFAFAWPAGYQNPYSTVTIGNVTGPCGYPSATRTIPVYVSGTTYNVIISTTGVVQVEWLSGPAPATGQVVGLNGTFDLLSTTYYSAADSATFQRNNCPAGDVGSHYTYKVIPYEYASTASQTAANQLAANDVSANGQNNANVAGTCSPACGFTFNSSISNQSIGTFTTNGTTVTFNLEFPSPAASWTGGTVGTISGLCLPAASFNNLQITDQVNPNRVWLVSVTSAGVVSISLMGSINNAPALNGEIIIAGSYALSQ